MNITLIATPDCYRCKTTAATLTRYGLTHTYALPDTHPDAHALSKALGYATAPVVIVHDDHGQLTHHWDQHRPDIIRRLAQDQETAHA